MAAEIFSELRKIRNELAHSRAGGDAEVFAHRLRSLSLSIPQDDLTDFARALLPAFSPYGGQYHVPVIVLRAVEQLLAGRAAKTVCDPWAGIGEILASVCGVLHPQTAYALVANIDQWSVGQVLVPQAKWKLGSPLSTIAEIPGELDVLASILPFGLQAADPLVLTTGDTASTVTLRGELGSLIIAAATSRLSKDGIALFVVTPSFFSSQRSVIRDLPAIGVGLEGAFQIPSGAFAPYTSIATYLVLASKCASGQMFVAELSSDPKTNETIFENFKQRREAEKLELGRLVDPLSFTGFGPLRMRERLDEAARTFQAPSVRLDELAVQTNLGRSTQGFEFPQAKNAIYIPLIGSSDVVESSDDMTLKRQNYAQVIIDPEKSDARFVAHFLNSELGKELREASKTGFIPKLSKQTLQSITIFIPEQSTQRHMLEVEASIAAEQNILASLQSELGAHHRQLWSNPQSASTVRQSVSNLSKRISGELKQHAEQSLGDWCETLPFPLASICRAWQATASDDFKSKYEHLLHLFEATAEFVSIIFLSAFSSNEAVFAPYRPKLADGLKNQNLSLTRATFGTWKFVIEYFGKQTREFLGSTEQGIREACGEMFGDNSLDLPRVLSRKPLAAIVSATNKMRNDWGGHGGAVGHQEARLRNELLAAELQKLREIVADLWPRSQLVRALHCRPRRGIFENEIAILMGSNSEFLKESRPMPTWLDVESLYLHQKETGQVLKLLPLVQIGPSPQSAKNACYFFSRVERSGAARFVSYHFIDEPEWIKPSDESIEAIKGLVIE